MKSRVVFSSLTNEWSTPKAIYEQLDAEFHFDFDPCPLGGDQDGLSTLFASWDHRIIFCNPPYDRIRKFLDRWREAEIAVYLVPSRTGTRWFHEVVLPHAAEIRFIKGRLKFGDAKTGAPFDSMVVIFRNNDGRQPDSRED